MSTAARLAETSSALPSPLSRNLVFLSVKFRTSSMMLWRLIGFKALGLLGCPETISSCKHSMKCLRSAP
jgi:hypothetical protein